EIIRPRDGDLLSPGGNRLFGVAWTGEDSVSRVEVSTDGGATWGDATLIGPQAAYSWSLWEYLWEAESPGEYTGLVRATSSSGRVQTADHDPLNGGYLIHHSRPLHLRVTSGGRAADIADAQTILYDMNAYAEENMRRPLDLEMAFSAGDGI